MYTPGYLMNRNSVYIHHTEWTRMFVEPLFKIVPYWQPLECISAKECFSGLGIYGVFVCKVPDNIESS